MDELTEAVNLALDRVKAEQSLSSDAQLAIHLDCDRMAISRWRRGRFSRAFRTIIPQTVMMSISLPAGWAEQAKDIRVLAPLLKLPDIAS